MSNYNDIDYQLDEHGIVTLSFNTPARKNALSMLSFYEIYLAIKAFEQDSAAHCMIITGAEQVDQAVEQAAYSSGGYFAQDVYANLPKELLQQIDFDDIAQKRTTMQIFQCDKPIIAAINGLALGGAVTLTLAGADQIYMADNAWLQLPFAKLGISAELASSYLLPRLVGMYKAKELMFFSARISAQQAEQLGIATAVVPHAELLSFAHQRALQLVPPAGAPLSIRKMKRMLREPLQQQVSEALDRENKALRELFQTADFKEGVAARVERRSPHFRGL